MRLPIFDFCLGLSENGSVMVIDCHTHIFSPEMIAQREEFLGRDRWFGLLYANQRSRMATAEELIAEMDQAGIAKAVTFNFAWTDPGLCAAGNDYILDAVSCWPDRLVGFALVNPTTRGASAELERCLSAGLHGLGELMPDGQGYSFDDPALDRIVDCASEHQAPVLIHAGEPVGHSYAGKSNCTLQPFYHLARRHPQARFVAAHWGGGLIFYELMPEVRATLQNVYYDTAASPLLYQDNIWTIAAQIAASKVLFATDWPLLSTAPFVERVRNAGLTAEARDGILSGNAARLLGMEE